jgi:hypothetical protein
MGKKSKSNRGASKKKQKSARVQQGRVTNTSATSTSSDVAAVVGREIEPSTSATSIRRDSIDFFFELKKKKDYEEILELESDAVSQATVLEGTEPER